MQVPAQGRREKAGGLWQGYRLCDCIRKHSDSSVFGVLGAVLCCWEMWQPFPIAVWSVQNRCELSVSQHRSYGCGWCRSEPKLVSLLKYVHKEGSQTEGVEQAVVCGSSSWPSFQTFPQVQYTHFPTLLSLWFPSLTFAKTEHWFFPSTLALRSAGPCKTLKSPPWGVQHEQSFPLRSKQMTNSPSKIKDVFFSMKA